MLLVKISTHKYFLYYYYVMGKYYLVGDKFNVIVQI
jgi:hypothetical protein